MTMSTEQSAPRIPLGLQAVFLASNRGKEVDQPPPEKAASKTFSTRSWLFGGLRGGSGKSRRSKGTKSREERGNLQKVSQFGKKRTERGSLTDSESSSGEEPVAKYPASKPIETYVQKPAAPKPKVC